MTRSHPLDQRNDITQITPVPAARLKNTNKSIERISTAHDESGYTSESMFSTFEKNHLLQ